MLRCGRRSPLPRTLDHIAVVVPDLTHALRRFAEDFGVELDDVADVPEAETRTAFLPVSEPSRPTYLELVTPLDGRGPLVRHLEKRGAGLHHLCFRTDDLVGDMERLGAKGYQFTSAEPLAGAHGSRVAWIHPRSTGGVLIELVEHRHPGAEEPGWPSA